MPALLPVIELLHSSLSSLLFLISYSRRPQPRGQPAAPTLPMLAAIQLQHGRFARSQEQVE